MWLWTRTIDRFGSRGITRTYLEFFHCSDLMFYRLFLRFVLSPVCLFTYLSICLSVFLSFSFSVSVSFSRPYFYGIVFLVSVLSTGYLKPNLERQTGHPNSSGSESRANERTNERASEKRNKQYARVPSVPVL